jgi:hypothetical protein
VFVSLLAACGGPDSTLDASVPATACGLSVTQTFPASATPGVTIADLDLDGRPDVVASKPDGLLVIYSNNNAPAFTATTVALPGSPGVLAVADFTEDGRNDIAVYIRSDNPSIVQGIAILEGRPGRTFMRLAQTVILSPPAELVAGDFTGDGHQDVLAGSGDGVFVFDGTGTGMFNTDMAVMPLGRTFRFEVADIDGDDADDLISISEFKLHVRKSTTMTTAIYETGGVYARDLAIGDLDGDGDRDIAVLNADVDTVRLFTNDGGSFETHRDIPTDLMPDAEGSGGGSNLGAWVPWNVAIADLTADGINDVLVLIEPYEPYVDASLMLVLEQTPHQSFVKKQCDLSLRPRDVAVGDFVGDSRTDAAIVVSPYSSTDAASLVILQQAP